MWIRLGIVAIFFFSGATALVYEILWSRQFVTVFGNSAYAISIVLAAFMGGLGIGGILLGRVADRTRDPLRLYAILEVGIAISATFIPRLLELLRELTPVLFANLGGDLVPVSVLRLVFSFLVLLVPCTLIGGTLPVLARFCVDAKKFVGQRIGVLYGFNTLGGAFGCLLAGYYLIETLGITVTSRLAALGNISIAGAVILIRSLHFSHGQHDPDTPLPRVSKPRLIPRDGRAWILLTVAFLSGFTTLGCEVLWVRLLSFVCYSGPYTFTAILGFFLGGLALGSLIYRMVLARREDHFQVLGVIQVLIGSVVLAALLAGSWYINVNGPHAQHNIVGSSFFARAYVWPTLNALIFVFLPTIVMGIVFPLVCAAFTRSLGMVGRSVGLIYALNTTGCIVGSLAPVFLLIPLFGIQNSLVGICLLNGVMGVALLSLSRSGSTAAAIPWLRPAGVIALAVMVGIGIAAPRDLTQKLFLQSVSTVGPEKEIIYYGEGRSGTSMVLRDKIDQKLEIYINSVIEVPTTYLGHAMFRLMGHLGPLLHPNPDQMLVICFGGGIAGGAANLYPQVQSLEIVDIEASVVDAAKLLSKENNNLHESEKLKVYIEDGRNFLLRLKKKYPLILCDSTHPKSSDSWVLYTHEFYQTVDGCLDEPGVFIQWVPFHGISQAEYKIIVHTFLETFPNASLWLLAGHDERLTEGGHSLLVAMKPNLSFDMDQLARKLAQPAVRADLIEFELDTPSQIMGHFVCGPKTLKAWTKGSPINTDDLPLTQYLTKHSAGKLSELSMFAELLQSPWPMLINVDEHEATTLKERLELRLKSRYLALLGNWPGAHAVFPDDPKRELLERNFDQGVQYHKVKRKLYSDLSDEASPPTPLPDPSNL